MENYWSKFVEHRISRRRAVQGLAAVGVGAAGLAILGCGGGVSERDRSGLLGKKEDTSSQAVQGGTWQDLRTEDVSPSTP